MSYEYVVVPAPKRAPKVKGAKTTDARFAHALTEVMNAYGAEGWEYLRSDTLPCEERSGFTGTKTVFQTLLVFRRGLEGAVHYALREADHVATPEELAAELAVEQAPAPRPVAAEPARAAPMLPRLGAARETGTGPAPRLGPAAEHRAVEDRAARVHPFPLAGADRSEGRGKD